MQRSQLAHRLAAPIWFSLLTVAVLLLTRLEATSVAVPVSSWAKLLDWIEQASPDEITIELLKGTTFCTATWLLLVSGLALMVRIRSPRSFTVAYKLLPRIARPIFQPAATLALSSSLLVGSAGFAAATDAGADQTGPPVLIHLGSAPTSSPEAPDNRERPPTTRADDNPLPELTHLGPTAKLDRNHNLLTSPIHAPSTSTATNSDGEWNVKPGDHFWSIAAAVVRESSTFEPSTSQVGEYWLRLIESNRGSLPDPSNPDLIYPGMTLITPAP